MNRYRSEPNKLGLALLLMFLLLGVSCLVTFLNPATSEVVDRDTLIQWQKGLVYLNYDNRVFCTGWFIQENIIVAPFHLIDGWVSFVDHFHIIVMDYKRDTYKAEIVGFKSTADILFLRISHKLEDGKYVRVGYKAEHFFPEYEQPQLYMDCVAMGFPYGWRSAVETKIISHFGQNWLGTDIIALKGSSGSVILTTKGKYMAMLTKRYGKAYVVPGILIKNGLENILEKE